MNFEHWPVFKFYVGDVFEFDNIQYVILCVELANFTQRAYYVSTDHVGCFKHGEHYSPSIKILELRDRE